MLAWACVEMSWGELSYSVETEAVDRVVPAGFGRSQHH